MAAPQPPQVRRLSRVVAQVQGVRAAPAADAGHALPAAATVCVTGAAGYVGGWLVKLLLERGHRVRACVRSTADDRKAGFLQAMPEHGGRLTLHSADMTKPGAYDSILDGVDAVFHPAEVFMSFGPGRDIARAAAEFGVEQGAVGGGVAAKAEAEANLFAVETAQLFNRAMASSQYLVDSINKNPSVRRLVYTSSVASMMPGPLADYVANPIIDERREPTGVDGTAYGATKRATEHFFAYQAARSGGAWSVVVGNPGDIIGPILSAHQAAETWQGKVAAIVAGEAPQPTVGANSALTGRPWLIVDVRDVAEAEIRLAGSATVELALDV
jgi:nucleoside-diphosphate-sugar epimerase